MDILSKIIKKDKNKNENFISLDVGLKVIRASVLQLNRNEEKIYILSIGEEKRPVDHKNVNDISELIDACKIATKKAIAMTSAKPKKVVIGINDNFVMGMAIKMKYQRNDPRLKIDANEIRRIIHKMQKDIFEKINNKIQKEFIDKNRVKITSAIVVDTSIDGYRVMDPVGFKGSEIEFNVFNSFLYHYKFDIIKKIANELQLDLFDVVSESYAMAMLIGAQDNIRFNAILVNIGYDITKVSIVCDGNVEGDIVFNIGERAFIKSLSDNLEINIKNAEKLKEKYSNNQLDQETSDRIRNVFKYDCDVLFTGVKISLKEFSNYNLLPTQIVLYGEGSQIAHIDEIISELFTEKKSDFPFKSEIKFIDTKDAINVIDKTNKINGSQYISSVSLANFVLDLEQENDTVNMILRNLVKTNY